jgi:WD40 repeat protein
MIAARFRLVCCVLLGLFSQVTLCVGQVCNLPEDAPNSQPPITCVTFTPDGQSVIVGSQAGLSVLRWPDLAQQKTIETVLVNIHDLAFSPDGTTLAVAGGTPSEEGLIEFLAWPSGESSFVLSGHKDSVMSVVWIDNATLASSSLDHDILVWDATSHEIKQRITGHSRGVSSLCFLPESNILVSAGLDQNLRVWQLPAGELIRTLNNHTREIHQIALRPGHEGLPMIASVANDRTVRLWQPTIGRMVRFTRLDSNPLAVAWLPSGTHFAVACEDGHVRLIDPDTLEILQDTPAVDGWAYSLAVHPTDGSLLVGGQHGQLKRVELEAASP